MQNARVTRGDAQRAGFGRGVRNRQPLDVEGPQGDSLTGFYLDQWIGERASPASCLVTQYGRRKRGRVDRTLQLLP